MTAPVRLHLVVESSIDVRTIEELARRFDLRVVARRIPGGVEISQPPQTPVAVLTGPPGRAAFGLLVARVLLRGRVADDAVLVQGYGLAALAANVIGRLSGVSTTMLVQSPIEAYYRCRRDDPASTLPFRRSELAALELIARANARLGRHYVAVSNYLADVVRNHGTGAQVDVVPFYGVDTSVFRPSDEDPRAIRARRGLPLDASLIFFSSRIAPEKDAESALLAVRSLRDRGREVVLLNRSGGWRDLLVAARRIGVADNVIATDAVHPYLELPDDYRACDVCVQASREEGLGFSVAEALACEIPVVATSVGGLPETVIDGRTGWVYPVGQPEVLAGQVVEVLDDPDEARRRAAAGRALVCERYEQKLVFDQLQRVVTERLEARPSSRLPPRRRAGRRTPPRPAGPHRTRGSGRGGPPGGSRTAA
jgi:glycosyltransferase involved in cell wall biosynthesis